MKNGNRCRSKAHLILLTPLLVGLTICSCSLDSPQTPEWDVNLTLPIINRVYSSADILNRLDPEHFAADSAGNSFFEITQVLDTVSLRNTLCLEPAFAADAKQIGPIPLVTPEPLVHQLAVADFLPLIAGEVPDTGILVDQPYDNNAVFSQISIASGGLIIQVSNNTGFLLDVIEYELYDNQQGLVLLEHLIPGGLEDGEMSLDTLPLAGKNFSSDLTIRTYWHTPGGPALTLADRTIDQVFGFTENLTAASVTGLIEAFTVQHQQITWLNTDHQVEHATLATGNLNLTVTNDLPVPAHVLVSFTHITNEVGPLIFDLELTGTEVRNVSRSIAGYTLRPVAASIRADVVVEIIPPAGEFVTIDQSDDINFELMLSDLRIASARGTVAPTDVEWTESSIEIDASAGFNSASFAQVDLELKIINASELPGNLVIALQADHGAAVTLSGAIIAGSRSEPSESIIFSHESASLLSPLPRSLIVSGTATVGDAVTTVDISEADFLTATARLVAPLRLQLGETYFTGAKELIKIDSEIRERVNRFNYGTFHGAVTNHLPLGAAITILIGTDSSTLYQAPLVTIGPLEFEGAATTEEGYVTAAVISEDIIPLAAEQVRIFENESVYVGSLVTTSGSGGETIQIRAGDHLGIIGYVEFNARIGGEDY